MLLVLRKNKLSVFLSFSVSFFIPPSSFLCFLLVSRKIIIHREARDDFGMSLLVLNFKKLQELFQFPLGILWAISMYVYVLKDFMFRKDLIIYIPQPSTAARLRCLKQLLE